MTQAYSNPKRESDPHALPDLEVFEHRCGRTARELSNDLCTFGNEPEDDECSGPGFYWQVCFPGCLPDSDPIGPFETEEGALADARDATDGREDDEEEAGS